jgi:hypothetical protein
MAWWRALFCAFLICGCAGEGGTALPIDNSFGTESPGSNGSEIPGAGSGSGGGGGAPTGSGASIEQICSYDCMRIDGLCPGSSGTTCVSDCSSLPTLYPSCVAELRAYLLCIETAPVTCGMGSQVNIDCPTQINAVDTCVSSGA